jgi:hypothetical protein
MVIGVVALLFALAGSAVAGTGALTIANTTVKKIAKKQAIKQIEKKAPAMSVGSAQSATTALSAVEAQTADAATYANAMNAYATFNADRTVNSSLSRGSYTVTFSRTGIICVDTPVPFKTLQATQNATDNEWYGSREYTSYHTVIPGFGAFGCPLFTDFATVGINQDGEFADERFTVWLGN